MTKLQGKDGIPPYSDDILKITRDVNDVLWIETADGEAFPISSEFKEALLYELKAEIEPIFKTVETVRLSKVLSDI